MIIEPEANKSTIRPKVGCMTEKLESLDAVVISLWV